MKRHYYINNADELNIYAREYLDVERYGSYGVDIETASDDPEVAFDPLRGWISTIQIKPVGADKTLLIDAQEIAKANPGMSLNRLLEPVVKIIDDPRVLKIAHNAKFEIKWFIQHLKANPASFYDTMLASQINSRPVMPWTTASG